MSTPRTGYLTMSTARLLEEATIARGDEPLWGLIFSAHIQLDIRDGDHLIATFDAGALGRERLALTGLRAPNQAAAGPGRVFVASPWVSPAQAHKAYARRALTDSLNRGEAPYVPHLLYTQVLRDEVAEERERSCKAALVHLAGCHRVAVYLDHGLSRGMAREVIIAAGLGIEVCTRHIDR